MVQSTESRQRDDLVRASRHRRRNSTVGRIFLQSEMGPVFVVIADVFSQQSSQMSLVQNDHVVEQIPTHTPNPALGDAVLSRASKSRADRFCSMLSDDRDDISTELRVPIEN